MQEHIAPPQNASTATGEETVRPPEAFAALLDQVLAGLPEPEPDAKPESLPDPPPPIPSVLTVNDQSLHDRRHPSMLERLFGRRRTGHAQLPPNILMGDDEAEHQLHDEQSAVLLRQVQTIWQTQDSTPMPVPVSNMTSSPAAVPGSVHDRDELIRRIEAATPDGMGTLEIPERQDALEALLATPPNDFFAQDLLRACWPKRGVTSRGALAVALNLSSSFGRTGRFPLASVQAWRLLDPIVFREALSQQLTAISDLILNGQKPNAPALTLEHGEIELIEYLFETLEPGETPELLASVMEFKGLSGRRFGLVRRIPTRARHRIDTIDTARRGASLPSLFQSRRLLLHLSDHSSFSPLAEAALRALTEIETLIEQVAKETER
ncbi:hypothetical protein [Magnetospirillum molischianum]|uniref:Uncharacterized protein n=1 Tax=Magnetospirillum molischianum DSM 120 TaxID=1150626 RepID=H8FPI8_MAGML|nr:hypothetical protein [Magnetospirillum molischianum]CCG40276.1 hypothetical protein PHAMO_190085 [Magnetospirillum molischianum DSM 120]